MDKLPVAVIGGTGTVGQNIIILLKDHPWFEVVAVSASENSSGKTYAEAVAGKWKMKKEIPARIANIITSIIQRTIFKFFPCFTFTNRLIQIKEINPKYRIVLIIKRVLIFGLFSRVRKILIAFGGLDVLSSSTRRALAKLRLKFISESAGFSFWAYL